MGPHLKPDADLENWIDVKIIHVSSFSGQKVLQSGSNYRDNACEKEALPIEQTTLTTRENEDVEVNITGYTKSSEPLITGDTCDDDDDTTECSSSFGDTGSGTENASAFSDDEVVSHMYANDPFSSMFYQDCEPPLIRWKKLTSHWNSFIRPLRWRCKWMELKLKQLKSQGLKYEKELAAYDYRRQLISANFALDGCETKSITLPKGICGKKVIKRKKRKKVEETCNLESYTSDHFVFSYFAEKDRLKNASGHLKNVKGVAEARTPESNEKFNGDDIFSHLENDLLSSLEHNDTDKTLLNIFRKIEAAQFEVHKLRTRIGRVVINENLGKYSSVNNLNTLGLRPSSGLNLYDPNSACVSRIKNTFSDRNQFMRKTKESVERRKSVSLAQASASDLVAKNDVSNMNKLGLEPSNSLNLYGPNSASLSEIKNTFSDRNQFMGKTKESVKEQKSVPLDQASAPELVAKNVVPDLLCNDLNDCSPSRLNVSRKKRSERKKSGSILPNLKK